MEVEYIDRGGVLQQGTNSLNIDEERQLRAHLRMCEVPLAECSLCWRLYQNIGHMAYAAALADATGNDGDAGETPTVPDLNELASCFVDNKPTLRLIEWLQANDTVEELIPRELVRAFPELTSTELANALTDLTSAGALRRVYKVKDPAGNFAPRAFYDPRDIPPLLYDSSQHAFDTAAADVLPVFYRRNRIIGDFENPRRGDL